MSLTLIVRGFTNCS